MLCVGTSGWAYPEWKPGFYPADLPRTRFLDHYARSLTACEINATFYRTQTPETFGRWARATPVGFRFAAKAHRRLTHSGFPLNDAGRAFLASFLDSLAPLGERLGPILLQFPPHRRRDDAALDDLVAALPDGHTFAFEFRDQSWNDPDIADRIARAGGTVCLSETTGHVADALPPGPFAYARLRHDRYTDAARRGWRDLLRREASTRDVYAFVKHEGGPPDDPFAGVGLARWLCRA